MDRRGVNTICQWLCGRNDVGHCWPLWRLSPVLREEGGEEILSGNHIVGLLFGLLQFRLNLVSAALHEQIHLLPTA